MKRKIKLLLFGAPGVGKSSFAVRFPKPFFITTDGNYEWLDVWGAKEEDHIKVDTWKDAKKVFGKIDDKYETVVVDLLDDLFKWSEQEFCIEAGIEHISDLSWSKGYDIQRTDFCNTINKLINSNKHVILLMHETSIEVKNRAGISKTCYRPSNRLPDKVLDIIEGWTNVLRCYLDNTTNEKGQIIKKRMLSLVPKDNEWAILRGVNEDTLPQDIELNPDIFLELLHVETSKTHKEVEEEKDVKKVSKPKQEVKEEVKVEEPKQEVQEPQKEEVKEEIKEEIKEEVKEQPKQEAETKPLSQEDKVAAMKEKIRLKLLAQKK